MTTTTIIIFPLRSSKTRDQDMEEGSTSITKDSTAISTEGHTITIDIRVRQLLNLYIVSFLMKFAFFFIQGIW